MIVLIMLAHTQTHTDAHTIVALAACCSLLSTCLLLSPPSPVLLLSLLSLPLPVPVLACFPLQPASQLASQAAPFLLCGSNKQLQPFSLFPSPFPFPLVAAVVRQFAHLQFELLPAQEPRPEGLPNQARAAAAFDAPGFISGTVKLEPRAVKDPESTQFCTQVFVVRSCHPRGLEVVIADQRYLLCPGDHFFVPTHTFYHLCNHSPDTEAELCFIVLKPAATDADPAPAPAAPHSAMSDGSSGGGGAGGAGGGGGGLAATAAGGSGMAAMLMAEGANHLNLGLNIGQMGLMAAAMMNASAGGGGGSSNSSNSSGAEAGGAGGGAGGAGGMMMMDAAAGMGLGLGMEMQGQGEGEGQ